MATRKAKPLTRFDRERAEIVARSRRQRGLPPEEGTSARRGTIEVAAESTHDKHVQMAVQRMLDEALGRKQAPPRPPPPSAARRRPGRDQGNVTPTATESTSAGSENPMAQLLTSEGSAPEFAGTWAKPPMGLKPSSAELNKRREYLAWRTQIEEQATKEVHVTRSKQTPLARARSIGQSASWKTLGSKRLEQGPSRLFVAPAAAPEEAASTEEARSYSPWLW
jgi:hypothetical protein